MSTGVMSMYGHEHPSVAASYSNMGLVLRNMGKYQEALDMYSKSLEIDIRVHGDSHPLVATSKYNVAGLKEAQGDLEGARELFLECEQIYAKVFGADHKETLDAAMRGTSGCRSGRGWWRRGAGRVEFAGRRAANMHVGGGFLSYSGRTVSAGVGHV